MNLYRSETEPSPSGNMRAKLRFTLQALATALRDKPALVFVLHLGLLPTGVSCAAVSGSRVVVLLHGDEAWRRLPGWERRVVNRCDRILAVSRFTRDRFARSNGFRPEDLDVVHLPVNADLVRAALETDQVPTDRRPPRLVSVSRVHKRQRYKGLFDIAESLPLVLREVPDARWTVVGAGDDLNDLMARCGELGLDDAVDFRGTVSDDELAEAYGQAAAFVLPSVTDVEAIPPYGEGFGLVFAEAAMFGVPAIASESGGGSAEFVVPGENGLLVPARNPAALAAAIVRLLADTQLRTRLSQAARRQAMSQHLPQHFATALRRAVRA